MLRAQIVQVLASACTRTSLAVVFGCPTACCWDHAAQGHARWRTTECDACKTRSKYRRSRESARRGSRTQASVGLLSTRKHVRHRSRSGSNVTADETKRVGPARLKFRVLPSPTHGHGQILTATPQITKGTSRGSLPQPFFV